MDTSIFSDKNQLPCITELETALGDTYEIWKTIVDYVHSKYPTALDEWNYPGTKYGWNFRIKDKKRAIVYLLPRDKFFKVAFVLGPKATDEVLQSKVSDIIKTELAAARVYAEGRGIRIEIHDNEQIKDIKILIEIKIAH
jgi:hypothetical protein